MSFTLMPVTKDTAAMISRTKAFGMAREDLRDEFTAYLEEMVSVRKAAQ